jgi:hypothetical protein
MFSARATTAAAAQRVNPSAAFHPHDAARPALRVPTFQFGSPAQIKPKPNPDHPASDQLFATVAALQHLCDEHDMDHVSPPPIWPMILHGAMRFGGDDEAALTGCLDAIVHGNGVTIRLAIRGAIRILEAMYQRRCYLPFVPLADDAARVCMRALENDEDSVDIRCSKVRLIGLLCQTVEELPRDECCAALIAAVSRVRNKSMHDTCTAAIFYVYRSLLYAGSDLPLLDKLLGFLSGKMRPVVDPAAAGLLLLLPYFGYRPDFAKLLRCSVDQVLRRESAQAPVELWFAAALLFPEHKSHGHELGLSRIPFQTALQCLDGPPEVAEPAVALFRGLARLGWGEHAALQDDVLKRMPRLLTQGDAALCVEALSCLRENMVAHDVTFFVEALLPVLMDLTAAPVSAVPSPTRCPDPLRSRRRLATVPGELTTMAAGNSRCIPTAAAKIIADACVAHAEALVPALLKAPRLATFFHYLLVYRDDATRTAHGAGLAEALMHILSRLLASESYERVVRAVGVDTWHEIVDNCFATGNSTCKWKAAIGMAILEHEDMERRLRILEGLRHCLARSFTQDLGGGWHPALHEAVSLRQAAKILECCASADSRTGEGWTILHALASAGEGDDEKTVSIVNLIHAQQHVLVAALQHPSMNVRLAALRCASTVVAAASFPRIDRLAMMDVLVRCLREMREEAQAAALPHPSKPREDDYSDEFEAVATLWRFDEGEDRWTGGANGTVKVLTHRLLADNFLFIFRDANGKLMAYHPFTSDTQLVKVDDMTWEWRAEKDYADDDEGFTEQFRLSLQSSERASHFQHYVTQSNRQDKGQTDAAFSGPSPVTAWTAVQHVSVVDNAEVRNPFLAATQHPFGRVGRAQASTNSFVFPQPAVPGSSPTPGSNPFFSAYKPVEATTVENEFVTAAEKAFGSYSVATRQTFVDAVLHAAIHGPAKNVKRPTKDDRSKFDEEYRLAALTALRTWCESDVTSEPVACCPAAQRLVDNGGAMEVALVAIASYDSISHAACNGWAVFGVTNVGRCVMTILQKHVLPDAIHEALGEDLHTSIAALVTLMQKFTPFHGLRGPPLRNYFLP